jgi:hypothetical protein
MQASQDEWQPIRAEQRQFWQAKTAQMQQECHHLLAEPSEPGRVSLHLLELADIQAGYHVLDVACGVGDPAFLIAQRVGEQGHVHGVDVTMWDFRGSPFLLTGTSRWPAGESLAVPLSPRGSALDGTQPMIALSLSDGLSQWGKRWGAYPYSIKQASTSSGERVQMS